MPGVSRARSGRKAWCRSRRSRHVLSVWCPPYRSRPGTHGHDAGSRIALRLLDDTIVAHAHAAALPQQCPGSDPVEHPEDSRAGSTRSSRFGVGRSVYRIGSAPGHGVLGAVPKPGATRQRRQRAGLASTLRRSRLSAARQRHAYPHAFAVGRFAGTAGGWPGGLRGGFDPDHAGDRTSRIKKADGRGWLSPARRSLPPPTQLLLSSRLPSSAEHSAGPGF